jgi:hypothetical protein
MKNQRKPIIVNSTSIFIEKWMEERSWSLLDSIEAIESGYPFYDAYDVLAQLINYSLWGHAFLFFLKRRFSKKNKIYLKDWKIIISRLVIA